MHITHKNQIFNNEGRGQFQIKWPKPKAPHRGKWLLLTTLASNKEELCWKNISNKKKKKKEKKKKETNPQFLPCLSLVPESPAAQHSHPAVTCT